MIYRRLSYWSKFEFLWICILVFLNVSDTMPESSMFRDKIILAPMVRMNTLPFRLLSLEQGADLVFSEEIIDYKLLKSERQYNDILDTIDYIDKADGSLIFRTCSKERNKIIFQIGTNNPERAAEVALLIEQDVAGIDINMGCPKHFSISGGMGAALLKNCSKAQLILKHVKQAVKIPVTCKIRVLENVEQTISFCKSMQNAGVAAITVHGRTKEERPRHANRNSVIKEIASRISLPIIANGGSNDIQTYEDILKFRKEAGSSSVMIARAAQENCSVFNKTGKLDSDEIIRRYLMYAITYDNVFHNTKYCVQSMLGVLQDSPRGKKFLETQTLEQLYDIWGLVDFYRRKRDELDSKGLHTHCGMLLKNQINESVIGMENVLRLPIVFLRFQFPIDSDLPKTVLYRYSRKRRMPQPEYEMKSEGKLFQSILTFNEQKYASHYWEKNKKSAEQAAAIVCLYYLKIYDENQLRSKEILR